jgi:hypothetical protein
VQNYENDFTSLLLHFSFFMYSINVSNYVFSESLEISVIEYRLIQLFEMLEKINTPHFFPSIIFNETFWQLPNEKKLSVLSFNQIDWILQNPIHASFFFVDPGILDVLRSVKVAYFSYSKVDFKSLIDFLRSKNIFSITEFASFGDVQQSPIVALNKLFSDNEEVKQIPVNKNHIDRFDTLAKISAVKFYTRFVKQKNINILVLGSGKDSLYWEFFFKSLKILDTKQKTKILSNLSIFYTSPLQKTLDNFGESFASNPVLNELYTNQQLNLDILDITNFKTKVEFNYIYSCFNLSYQPADIFIKSGRDIYNLVGRLVYTENKDPGITVKKVAEFQSPFSSNTSLEHKDLEAVDIEISANVYTNKKIIDLIEKNLGFLEGTYVRFSSVILNFLIHAVQSLKSNGYIEIWDINETRESLHFQSVYRNNNETVFLPVNYDLYSNILRSFKDITVDVQTRNLQKVLSDELLNVGNEFISLESFIMYLLDTPSAWRKVFTIDHFLHKKELEKIISGSEIFQKFYKNRVLLFGIPSILYKSGYKNFKRKILADPILSKYIDKELLNEPAANNYKNEYLVAMVPNITNQVTEQKYTLITKDKESSQNKDFYQYLERIGFDKDKVMAQINDMWDELLVASKQRMNLSLMEIQKK